MQGQTPHVSDQITTTPRDRRTDVCSRDFGWWGRKLRIKKSRYGPPGHDQTLDPSDLAETSDTCATRSRQCCADCLLGWALLHGPCVPRTGRPSPVAFSYKLPACVLVAWLLAAQCRPACSCWAFSAAPQALQCCFTPPPQSRTPPPPRLPGISCGKLSTTSPLWET
jgi:hypothetical protein